MGCKQSNNINNLKKYSINNFLFQFLLISLASGFWHEFSGGNISGFYGKNQIKSQFPVYISILLKNKKIK
jgi:hypothetical protein